MKIKTESQVWINGYEGLYKISNTGNVYSFVRKSVRILKPAQDGGGYPCVSLVKDSIHKTFKVHRLVASHFIGVNCEKNHVNHIDGNKKNNHFTNLEWVTQKENNYHSMYKLGRCGSPFGVSVRRQLGEIELLTVVTLLNSKSVKSIAEYYKINPSIISNIKRFHTYSETTKLMIDGPIKNLNRFSRLI